MSAEGVDLKKRRFLTAATSVVGAVGVGFAAVPFLASWQPSERAKALGAPEEADISKLELGGILRVKWCIAPSRTSRICRRWTPS
jgi:ubiquinol-cytochrome c reductase iron-sulfur subunit